MVAGIEFGKDYAQLCIQTEQMKEPESISLVAGREEYLMPADGGAEDREQAEKLLRRCLRLMKPYGTVQKLEYLVFCVARNTPKMRRMLRTLAEIYDIAPERVHFIDKKESFCTYVFHQSAELLVHNALLVENSSGVREQYLLHRGMGTMPVCANVRDVSAEQIEDLLAAHSISSVFLVGDFEQEWMDRYLKLLKAGRRVFAGKNLYVKGAAFRAAELLKDRAKQYYYFGEETLRASIGIRAGARAEDLLVLAEAGTSWYEADTELEVLLMDGRELEFVIAPADRKERVQLTVPLDGLPDRPPKTTRLRIALKFADPSHARLTVRDLGFGELFAQSDMVYEGELQWEQ